eukprot:Rhum_TRINITY_DN14735_c0_g1::Rhum_TRINITY_DN14735_c0_g1_i1::g.112411::m.112411
MLRRCAPLLRELAPPQSNHGRVRASDVRGYGIGGHVRLLSETEVDAVMTDQASAGAVRRVGHALLQKSNGDRGTASTGYITQNRSRAVAKLFEERLRILSLGGSFGTQAYAALLEELARAGTTTKLMVALQYMQEDGVPLTKVHCTVVCRVFARSLNLSAFLVFWRKSLEIEARASSPLEVDLTFALVAARALVRVPGHRHHARALRDIVGASEMVGHKQAERGRTRGSVRRDWWSKWVDLRIVVSESPEEAWAVLAGERSLTAHNLMEYLTVCAEHKDASGVERALKRMRGVRPSSMTVFATHVMRVYAAVGDADGALEWLKKMEEPDALAYATLLRACNVGGRYDQCVLFYKQSQLVLGSATYALNYQLLEGAVRSQPDVATCAMVDYAVEQLVSSYRLTDKELIARMKGDGIPITPALLTSLARPVLTRRAS